MRSTRLLVPMLVLVGCGPAAPDLDDVYPRNCGVEGPVELFEGELSPTSGLQTRRAGDRVFVQVIEYVDDPTIESWVVDRCGEPRTLVHEGPWPGLQVGVAGDHVLSCDPETGAMAWLDPDGIQDARPLFPSVEECRVVSVGGGLAARERGGGTVWFRPEPADPNGELIVVTEAARIASPDWIWCSEPSFECPSRHPFGLDIRAAGDELLVALADDRLLGFSSTSLATRIVHPGPLFAMDVLPGGDRVVVHRDLASTLVVDRHTGNALEFGYYSDYQPLRQMGSWLVQGSFGPPFDPIPDEWTNFRAHDLRTGATTTVVGNEEWSALARLSADTILAEISPYWSSDDERFVVSLSTGERRPVDLPGDEMWTVPGTDGVFVLGVGDDGESPLVRYLAGPDEDPEIILEGAEVAYATTSGRMVLRRPHSDETVSLVVRLPNGDEVEIERGRLGTFEPYFYAERWPLDLDDVLYAVVDGDRWTLKRTVLP